MYDINKTELPSTRYKINENAGVVPDPTIDLGYAKLAEDRAQREESIKQRNEQHLQAEMEAKMSAAKDNIRPADQDKANEMVKEYQNAVKLAYGKSKNGQLDSDTRLQLDKQLAGINNFAARSNSAWKGQIAQEKDMRQAEATTGVYGGDDVRKAWETPLDELNGGNYLNHTFTPRYNVQTGFNKTMIPLAIQSGEIKPEDVGTSPYGDLYIKETANIEPKVWEGLVRKYEQTDPRAHAEVVNQFAWDKDGTLKSKYNKPEYDQNPMQKYSDRMVELIQPPLNKQKMVVVKPTYSPASRAQASQASQIKPITINTTKNGDEYSTQLTTEGKGVLVNVGTEENPDNKTLTNIDFWRNPSTNLLEGRGTVAKDTEKNNKLTNNYEEDKRKLTTAFDKEIAIFNAISNPSMKTINEHELVRKNYSEAQKRLAEDYVKNLETEKVDFKGQAGDKQVFNLVNAYTGKDANEISQGKAINGIRYNDNRKGAQKPTTTPKFDYSKAGMEAKAKEMGKSVEDLKKLILAKKPNATFE